MSNIVVAQVEFGDTTIDAYTQAGGPALFCSGVGSALNVTILCNSLVPTYEGNILLAGILFQAYGPINVYGDAVANVNAALVANKFFTLAASYVTNVAVYYHPDSFAIGMIVMMLGIFYATILLVHFAHVKTETSELAEPIYKRS
jgi:hypothetical protein